MNWLDFFASVVSSLVSLAWPAAVVASVWLFRSEIRPLLPRLRLKHKDTEVSFRLDEAEKFIDHLPPPSSDNPPPPPEELSRVERLADLSPAAVVLEARRQLEGAIRYKAGQLGENLREQPSHRLLRRLRETKAISSELFNSASELRAVGNIVSHDDQYPLSKEDALRYRELADHVVASLYFDDGNVAVPTGKIGT